MWLIFISIYPFQPNVKIDDKTGSQEQAEVTIMAEDYLGLSSWVDNGNTTTNWYDRSTDTTRTWGVDQDAFGSSDCCDPVIRKQGDVVHVVWLEYGAIKYVRSLDEGLTFSPVVLLESSSSVDHPWIAVKGDQVAIVWRGSGGIKVACSDDYGETWNITLLPGTDDNYIPVIDADGRNFYAVFWGEADTIYYGVDVSMTEDCNSWENEPIRVGLMYSGVGPNPYPQSIVASGYKNPFDLVGGGMYIAYMHSPTLSRSDWRIYLARSLDFGATWDTMMVAPNGDNGIYYMPTIVADNQGNVHLFYFYRIDYQEWALFHSMSTDRGNTWSDPIQVSDTTFQFVEEPGCNIDNVSYDCWPGHYIDSYADDERVYVAWADNRTGYFHVYSSYAYIEDLLSVTGFDEKDISSIAFEHGGLVYNSPVSGKEMLRVYSVDGRQILAKEVSVRKGSNFIPLNLEKAGIYLVKIGNERIKVLGGVK